MIYILEQLKRISPEIDILIFPEEMILSEKETDWPKVDALVCFYSEGFPLYKA
jgi:inositol hexakisphosphate/diphosphoinositol-pentakisphosphate kinase